MKIESQKLDTNGREGMNNKDFFLCTVGYLSATTATAPKEKSNSNGTKWPENCKHGSLKENQIRCEANCVNVIFSK